MKSSERSNGLDTALYKNYLYLFFSFYIVLSFELQYVILLSSEYLTTDFQLSVFF